MALYLATVTSPALQRPLVIRLEDSVPAGSMSLVVSAQNVPRDTTASPTADVSNGSFFLFWFQRESVLVSESTLKYIQPNVFPSLSLLQRVSVAADCVTR